MKLVQVDTTPESIRGFEIIWGRLSSEAGSTEALRQQHGDHGMVEGIPVISGCPMDPHFGDIE